MTDRLDLLINILFDNKAREDEKDDAILIIEKFDDIRALNALAKAGSDPTEDPSILEACGESIGRIWIRLNSFDSKLYVQLQDIAKFGAYINIRTNKPDWIPLLNEVGPNWSSNSKKKQA